MEKLIAEEFMGMVVFAIAAEQPSARFTVVKNNDAEQEVMVELNGERYSVTTKRLAH